MAREFRDWQLLTAHHTAMALKTQPTKASATDFIASLADARVRADCKTIADIMKKATGERAEMWGPGIVGFGRYRYRYPDGREMEWMLTAFAPRKAAITLYLTAGAEPHAELLAKLGKHSVGKGCLYIKRLADVDVPTLTKLVNASVKRTRQLERERAKSKGSAKAR
jgi:hypothetical protein